MKRARFTEEQIIGDQDGARTSLNALPDHRSAIRPESPPLTAASEDTGLNGCFRLRGQREESTGCRHSK